MTLRPASRMLSRRDTLAIRIKYVRPYCLSSVSVEPARSSWPGLSHLFRIPRHQQLTPVGPTFSFGKTRSVIQSLHHDRCQKMSACEDERPSYVMDAVSAKETFFAQGVTTTR